MLTQEETVLQISSCSGKLGIKAVLMKITTYKKVVHLGKEVYDTLSLGV